MGRVNSMKTAAVTARAMATVQHDGSTHAANASLVMLIGSQHKTCRQASLQPISSHRGSTTLCSTKSQVGCAMGLGV